MVLLFNDFLIKSKTCTTLGLMYSIYHGQLQSLRRSSMSQTLTDLSNGILFYFLSFPMFICEHLVAKLFFLLFLNLFTFPHMEVTWHELFTPDFISCSVEASTCFPPDI